MFSKRFRKVSTIALVIWLLISSSPAGTQSTTPNANAPYLTPSLPLDQRVDDLISRMTMEEKVSQMMNAAPAIPRLGIAEYDWWNEALHGVAFSGVSTVFPQAIGLGATFDQMKAAPSITRHSAAGIEIASTASRFGRPT
jgi:beta-glucosidase